MNQILNREIIEELLKETAFVSELHILEEIDSTNRYLKELAEAGAKEGIVVVADRQSKGRGRLGRSFYSPEHTGIYMSVLLRPEIDLEKVIRITSMAAVAVARAIENVSGIQAQIKWVNDIFLNRKKACGILAEAGLAVDGGKLNYVVLGIGINVGAMEFPEELKDIATSVCNETDRNVTRNELIAEVLKELAYWYPTLWTGEFVCESRKRSILLGKEITVLGEASSYTAKAVDLDDMGHLMIEKNGKTEVLNSGEVSIRF